MGAGVAVGCARTSALIATGCMGVATCGAGETEEYATGTTRQVERNFAVPEPLAQAGM